MTNFIETERTELRNKFYHNLTKHFDAKTQKVITELVGRNSEIAYILFFIIDLIDLDIQISDILEEKNKAEETTENFYLESLHDLLFSVFIDDAKYSVLKEGVNATCRFYPKHLLFSEFCLKLNSLKVATVGTKKFTSLLRDVGFTEGLNLSSQRHQGTPKLCIILTKDIKTKINFEERLLDFQTRNGTAFKLKEEYF